jgi:hypothetical protein
MLVCEGNLCCQISKNGAAARTGERSWRLYDAHAGLPGAHGKQLQGRAGRNINGDVNGRHTRGNGDCCELRAVSQWETPLNTSYDNCEMVKGNC